MRRSYEPRGAATEAVATTLPCSPSRERDICGEIPGSRSKNLFLRDKKGRMSLFSCLADADVNLKRLAELIGARGRLSFGSDERLMKYLGVLPARSVRSPSSMTRKARCAS